MIGNMRLVLGGCLLTSAALWSPNLNAAVLEEFLFDDDAGTAIEAAANSAVPTHLFDVDADLVDVTTNGLGQLDASLKANNDFGTTYVDADDVAVGSLYGVLDFSYAFDSATLDAAENEEVRISFIQFDPRSTFVTTEFEFQREDDDTVTLLGNGVGDGATDIDPVVVPNAASVLAVLAADLDKDVYQVHYSLDGGASFTTIGTGLLDPTRGFGSLRLTLNNDLSNDSVLIDSITLLDTNPYPGLIADISTIPEPASASLLACGVLLSMRRRRPAC